MGAMGMRVECHLPEGYESLVDKSWLRYREAARYALAYAKGGKRKRTRVDNLTAVVKGTSDLPESVQTDTFAVTRHRLTSATPLGSSTRLPLSPASLKPMSGGFGFPLLDGDIVYLGTTDPRFDAAAIQGGWLLVHRPTLDSVVVEIPDAPVTVPAQQTVSVAVSLAPIPSRTAPPHAVGRQVCVHDSSGEVVPILSDPTSWECHPHCPVAPRCSHHGDDPQRLFVQYRPLCPLCAVPLVPRWETAAGRPTDWRCANPSCKQYDKTSALAADSTHGWVLTEESGA